MSYDYYHMGSYSNEWCTRFAVWCARKALAVWEREFPEDKRPAQAIEAAQNWLDNPTTERKSIHSAAVAANIAANSVDRNPLHDAAKAAFFAAYSANESVTYAGSASGRAASALGITGADLFDEYKRFLDKRRNTISLQELNAGLLCITSAKS